MKQKKRIKRTNKRKQQDLKAACETITAAAQAGKKIHVRQYVPMDSRPSICTWKQDEFGTWIGTCGIAWELIEGDLKENHVNYCPQCGGGVYEQ